MKPNRLKILGIVLAALLVLFGGLFYYASTKLRPEEIKRITIEETKKVFPNAEVSLQSVDIGWGFNFKINLQKFSLKTTKDNQSVDMMSVDELVVKVPIWAIITGAGVVEVKLDAPLMTTNFKKEITGHTPWGPRSPKRKKRRVHSIQPWGFLEEVKSM
jgi:hypothetical protein